jgi:predicted nucleotidyltransferase
MNCSRGLTSFCAVNKVLDDLLTRMRQALGEGLVGLYLYGSLVSGGYIDGVSDFDLLAATADDIGERDFRQLQRMHLDFINRYPEWDNRVEIAYVSVRALETFRTQASRIAVISPGEPFHYKDAGRDWLINWWLVRESGRTLCGPDPRALIGSISKAEYLEAVAEHARQWGEWVKGSRHRKALSYATLTMCRALYAVTHGEQVSKQRAASWVQERFPERRKLIGEALAWRIVRGQNSVVDEATFCETEQFVHFMIAQVATAMRRE